ncbi:MAG: YdcF family protein, partial [Patescibacteria group bacterium]
KWAPRIVVSSDIKNLTYGSYPNLAKKLKEAGVPSKNIITELQSTNTYEEAVNIIEMCIKKKWKKIILVASHYHQPRAFLTFLKVLKKRKINLQIINSPVKDLSWFKKNKWGVRLNLLDQEFKKIDNYKKKGHIASYKEAIKYQEWKEKKK